MEEHVVRRRDLVPTVTVRGDTADGLQSPDVSAANPNSQAIRSWSATFGQALPSLYASTASPWPVFWVASMAVFLVSMDGTMLFAACRSPRCQLEDAGRSLLGRKVANSGR